MVENSLAVAPTLARLVNIEVEDAQRLNFLDGASLVSNEEVLGSHLNQANHVVTLREKVESVVIRSEKFSAGRDHLG